MKALAVVLAGLVVALQYPLWFGKGGWLRVRELDRQVVAQQAANAGLKARNDALDAEVRDLKQGLEAIEERARTELGMIRKDEVFYQVVAPGRKPSTRDVIRRAMPGPRRPSRSTCPSIVAHVLLLRRPRARRARVRRPIPLRDAAAASPSSCGARDPLHRSPEASPSRRWRRRGAAPRKRSRSPPATRPRASSRRPRRSRPAELASTCPPPGAGTAARPAREPPPSTWPRSSRRTANAVAPRRSPPLRGGALGRGRRADDRFRRRRASTATCSRCARGDDTGGVFRILRMGVRTGEFAFNGWMPEPRRSGTR